MTRIYLLPALVVFLLAVPAGYAAGGKDKPVNWGDGIAAPFATPSASNRPQVVERPGGAQLTLPEGFVIEEYASGDFERPRFMILGPNNEIVMSDSGARNEPTGKVFVIVNRAVKEILSGLDRSYGLAFHEDWLYVGETTSVKRYKYDRAAMEVSTTGEEIASLAEYDRGHWTRSLLFNADHSKLYVTVGSGSNISTGEPEERATILEMNPDGSGRRIWASGLRNVIGFHHYPGTEEMWAAVQERDGLGDDIAHDYLVNVEEGGFYGWPYAYNGPNAEPRHIKEGGKLKADTEAWTAKTLYPDVLLGAHVAVLDTEFYTGKMFPEKYQGGLFLAFHGSWNRAKRQGYAITFIPFKDGEPTSGPEQFLTGWMMSPDDRRVWGRPVGVLQMPDGSLLVSDDGGKKLWRIYYAK